MRVQGLEGKTPSLEIRKASTRLHQSYHIWSCLIYSNSHYNNHNDFYFSGFNFFCAKKLI
jgi:hypothetical protein